MQRRLGLFVLYFSWFQARMPSGEIPGGEVRRDPGGTQTGTTKTMDGFLKHAEKTTGVKWELYQGDHSATRG